MECWRGLGWAVARPGGAYGHCAAMIESIVRGWPLKSQYKFFLGNISRRRDMLYGTQRGGQMRHFRKDLKTATRLGAVLDPFKSIIYTSIRARARRFIFFYF